MFSLSKASFKSVSILLLLSDCKLCENQFSRKSIHVAVVLFLSFVYWSQFWQVKEVIKLIQIQQKKDFAMANKSVKSNRDLPKRLWRVGEVHTNLEISMLSFLLLGNSLDLFEEDKSTTNMKKTL